MKPKPSRKPKSALKRRLNRVFRPLALTGRKYKNVEAMMKGERMSQRVQKLYQRLKKTFPHNLKRVHRFTLSVTTFGTRHTAEMAILAAFAIRQPDGCEFQLHRTRPNTQAQARGLIDESKHE